MAPSIDLLFSSHFWFKFIFVSSVWRIWPSCCSMLHLLAFMKVSHCRLGQWYVYFFWEHSWLGFWCQRILQSTTFIAFCCLPDLSMLLSSPLHSFILRMYEIIDFAIHIVFTISDRFISFSSLTMASCASIELSLDFTSYLQSKSCQMPFQHQKSTPALLSSPFCLKVMRDWMQLAMKLPIRQLSKFLFSRST